MQTIDLEMSKDLSDALFNPRESSILREPSREGLLDYGSGRERAGFGATRGGRKKTEPKGAIGMGDTASTAKEKHPTWPPGHWGTGKHRRPPGIHSRSISMSDAASSLPDRIEQYGHALTASELAELLAVSRITVFKPAKAGRIPSFRVGTCVRFDPRAVANWLRKM